MSSKNPTESSYKKRMMRKKTHIDAAIEAANIDKGVMVILSGLGKGKTSSALGMICRALGYGMRVGLVQFIKGDMETGENLFLKNQENVEIIRMKTGFTWETQDREFDTKKALATWQKAEKMLKNTDIDLLVLDELTYMLNYKYLDENTVISAIEARPKNQHLVITGRSAPKSLIKIADTVSEVKNIKHAFNANIKAQKGVDF